MTDTKHPCSGLGLTKAQKHWFECVAVGYGGPPPSKKAAEVLQNFGLIERLPDKVIGRDRFGEITVPSWQATTWAHMDFCAWCAENDVGADL